MIRRCVYDQVGLYNPSLRQLPDFDMWIRVCARYEIRVMPEQLTAFRILSGHRNTSAATPESCYERCGNKRGCNTAFLT